MIVLLVVAIIVFYIFSVIGMWRVFRKAGHLGVLSIIPIVNLFVICKIAWGRYARAILWFIPIVNIVCAIRTYNKLSKSFGHGVGFTVGLIFLPLIFYILLGFDSGPYLGPSGEGTDHSTSQAAGYGNSYQSGYQNGNQNGYRAGSTSSQFTSLGGTQQAERTTQFCPHCGKEISIGSKFCKYCGTELHRK